MNVEDYCLWDSIQMDFAEFEAKHFDELNSATWRVVRDYCYIHGFWIDHNFGPGRTRTTAMLRAVEADWNNKWTIEQIQWVEARYNSLSRYTRKRKQKLSDNIPGPSALPSQPALSFDNSMSFDDHQPVPYRPTSKIRDDCECIPKRSTVPTLPTQALPIQVPTPQVMPIQAPSVLAPSTQAPPVQAPPIQVPPAQEPPAQAPRVQALPVSAPSASSNPGCEQPKKPPERVNIFDAFTDGDIDAKLSRYPASRQEEIAGPLAKDVFKVVTPEEFVTPDKVVTPEEVLSSTQVFNSRFVDDKKNPRTHKDYEKSRLIVQADNNKDKNLELTQSPIIQQAYDLDRDFYIRPPPKLSSLPGALSDCIVKFAMYHPHYKEKLVSNPTRIFACAARPGLVAKKGEPPRTALHLLSHSLQPPSPLFSLTIFECALISEWQLSSTLASFHLLADYSSVKLTSEEAIKETEIMTKDCGNLTPTQHLPEASFDLFCATQTVEFSPDDIALLNKRLQWQITNKSRGLRYIKLDQDTLQLVVFTDSSFANNKDMSSQIGYVICLADATNKANIIHWSSIKCKRVTRSVLAAELYGMAHGFDIEKRHWGRYQIIRTKSYQHQHYGMGETGKHETGEYGHLTIF